MASANNHVNRTAPRPHCHCQLTIVDHERTIGMFESGVRCQDGVVRFDNGRGNLRGWINGKFQFGFFTIINTETFHQQRCKTRSSTTCNASKESSSWVESSRIEGIYLRSCGRSEILEDRYIGQPIYEYDRVPNRRFLFRWCSDLEHSCSLENK